MLKYFSLFSTISRIRCIHIYFHLFLWIRTRLWDSNINVFLMALFHLILARRSRSNSKSLSISHRIPRDPILPPLSQARDTEVLFAMWRLIFLRHHQCILWVHLVWECLIAQFKDTFPGILMYKSVYVCGQLNVLGQTNMCDWLCEMHLSLVHLLHLLLY